MHIPGLVSDIYSLLEFAVTVFFISLGFYFIMQCQCTDLGYEEEDDYFDAEAYFEVLYNRPHRQRNTNTDTTDTDTDRESRFTDTDTDTDRDFPTPSAPPVQYDCFVCGDFATILCSRCYVARYCSYVCQIKHWGEGHELVCNGYRATGNIVSARAGSSIGRGPSQQVNGASTSTTQPSKSHNGASTSTTPPSKSQNGASTSTTQPSRRHSRSFGDCPICFSAIRTYKHSRHWRSCQICHQKFHTTCINPWFAISKKSTCPCCLSQFESGGSTGQSSNSRN